MNIFHPYTTNYHRAPRFYNFIDFQNYLKEIRMRAKGEKTIGNITNIEQAIEKTEMRECDLRDLLGLDCQITIGIYDEATIPDPDPNMMYTEDGISILDTIKNEGLMSSEDLDKIKEENKILDEKLQKNIIE